MMSILRAVQPTSTWLEVYFIEHFCKDLCKFNLNKMWNNLTTKPTFLFLSAESVVLNKLSIVNHFCTLPAKKRTFNVLNHIMSQLIFVQN